MFGFLQSYFPAFILAVVVMVVICTELLKKVVLKLENYLEKNRKQIKIFDYTKIWLAVFCTIIFSMALVLAGFLEWKQLFVYAPAILGLSIFLYETILKTLRKLQEDKA